MCPLPYLCTLLDLIEAFDTVPFNYLAACGASLHYNLFLLRLSIASYLLARVIDGLSLLLLEAGDRMVASSLYCKLTLFVDDSATWTFCTGNGSISEHAKAMNGFVQD